MPGAQKQGGIVPPVLIGLIGLAILAWPVYRFGKAYIDGLETDDQRNVYVRRAKTAAAVAVVLAVFGLLGFWLAFLVALAGLWYLSRLYPDITKALVTVDEPTLNPEVLRVLEDKPSQPADEDSDSWTPDTYQPPRSPNLITNLFQNAGFRARIDQEIKSRRRITDLLHTEQDFTSVLLQLEQQRRQLADEVVQRLGGQKMGVEDRAYLKNRKLGSYITYIERRQELTDLQWRKEKAEAEYEIKKFEQKTRELDSPAHDKPLSKEGQFRAEREMEGRYAEISIDTKTDNQLRAMRAYERNKQVIMDAPDLRQNPEKQAELLQQLEESFIAELDKLNS